MTERPMQGTPIPVIESQKWARALKDFSGDWQKFLHDELYAHTGNNQDRSLDFLNERVQKKDPDDYENIYALGFLTARRVLREADSELATVYQATLVRFEDTEDRKVRENRRVGGIYFLRGQRAWQMLSEQNLDGLFDGIETEFDFIDGMEDIELRGLAYLNSFVHGMADMYALAGSRESSDVQPASMRAFAQAFAEALMKADPKNPTSS